MKFITIGELLMRLSPPDYEKIRTTSSYVVNFAVASSVMKHSIHGDTNITDVESIQRLMNQSFDVQR